MNNRTSTQCEKNLVSLHQVDLDISGPLARSLLAEQERNLAEDRLASDNDASGVTDDQQLLNPDGATSKKRSRPTDLTDSPQPAKIAKTGEAATLHQEISDIRL
jgi:hypothetical protein